jgi:transposase
MTVTRENVSSQALKTMSRMDRASLERLLGHGLSLAEIGRRFDLHEGTVGYWVKKHGLEAVNRGKHASRGGVRRDELAVLVGAGLSIAQIAEQLGRSKGTVRHWLKRHDLKTYAQQGRAAEHSTRMAKAAGKATVTRRCRRHGMTDFWLEGRGYYRCKRCRMEHVNARRRKMKLILGGRGWRPLRSLWVRSLHRRAALPSSRPEH